MTATAIRARKIPAIQTDAPEVPFEFPAPVFGSVVVEGVAVGLGPTVGVVTTAAVRLYPSQMTSSPSLVVMVTDPPFTRPSVRTFPESSSEQKTYAP